MYSHGRAGLQNMLRRWFARTEVNLNSKSALAVEKRDEQLGGRVVGDEFDLLGRNVGQMLNVVLVYGRRELLPGKNPQGPPVHRTLSEKFGVVCEEGSTAHWASKRHTRENYDKALESVQEMERKMEIVTRDIGLLDDERMNDGRLNAEPLDAELLDAENTGR
ncbi:hypothetical protein B0H13DRAFT_1855943 [Mycena leptocephala]|nr:hypothetical protein B0H13DRAFT_1855943 [Mycena leptocephala]